MENLLSRMDSFAYLNRGDAVTAERVIHALIFILLLSGLWVIGAWVTYNYLGDLILKVASILLVWGITLLIMYVSFKKIGWNWWD